MGRSIDFSAPRDLMESGWWGLSCCENLWRAMVGPGGTKGFDDSVRRTLNNWKRKQAKKPQTKILTNHIIKIFEKSQNPHRSLFIANFDLWERDGIPKDRGPLTDFLSIFLQQHPDQEEPGVFDGTIARASQLDLLAADLYDLRRSDRLTDFKEKLLNSSIFEGNSSDENNFRERITKAADWSTLDGFTRLFSFLCRISILPLLDLEFTSVALPDFAPNPLFLKLLPTLKPGFTFENGEHKTLKSNKMPVIMPTARLMDLLACLEHLSKERSWPISIPSVACLARILNRNGKSTLSENVLYKLRGAQYMHVRGFKSLLDGLINKSDISPTLPLPLLIAANIFSFFLPVTTSITTSGDSEKTLLLLGDGLYMAWWRRHKCDLEVRGGRFGTKTWGLLE
jgi:hypothetical protein